jgi:formate dehydrogenase subunit delta
VKSPEKLVYMANQIAKFFAHEGEEKAAASVADHLRKYWDPRMRAQFISEAPAMAEALLPAARGAAGLLAKKAAAPKP